VSNLCSSSSSLGKHEQLGEDIFLELPKKITTFNTKTARYYICAAVIGFNP
jgi:hypothetical protein